MCDLLLQLRTLTCIHNLGWVDGCAVDLLFQNAPIFADQEIDAAGSFVLIHVDAVLARGLAAPVTQQGERDADLIGKGFISERAVHAHTQDLEVPHLLLSTAGEGENIKRQGDLLLPAVLAQRNVF
jgi:hypothetical protein